MKRVNRAFVNGNFVTMDRRQPSARAIAVHGDRVVLVGDAPDAIAAAGSGAEVYDLRGLTVVPGFNDAHLHLTSFGLGLDDVELSGARSIGDITKAIHARAAAAAPGEWVVAHGYNHFRLVERRHPTAVDLDMAAPANPVYLRHASGHLCVGNHMALRMAGIDRDTKDPEGGAIGRDPLTGAPDGILYGAAQILLRRLRLPHPGNEIMRALGLAGLEMARRGVTSCHEAQAGRLAPWEIETYRRAAEDGALKVRVCLIRDGAVIPAGTREPEGDTSAGHMLRLGPVKFFADGSVSTGAAAFSQPYEGDGPRAAVRADELERMAGEVSSGNRVAVHAIGDAAIDASVETIQAAAAGRPAERHRIEHCGLPTRAAIETMRDLGMIAVLEPSFIRESGEWYVSLLGNDRANRMFPAGTLIRAGVHVAFGTDAPASNATPLQAIHDAVHRSTEEGRVLGPDDRVSVIEALRCFTTGGAYASFEENVKGRIATGMLADFAVLSDDIVRTSPSRLSAIKVVATVIGGEPVFVSGGLGW
ncbi:MAG: amidohydrolase [Ignavibacteriales bacterium]